jgi:hypothetical protein
VHTTVGRRLIADTPRGPARVSWSAKTLDKKALVAHRRSLKAPK